jgi:hypothetical protein
MSRLHLRLGTSNEWEDVRPHPRWKNHDQAGALGPKLEKPAWGRACGLVLRRTPEPRENKPPATTWYCSDMPTTFAEIQAGLDLTESEVERMRRQFRSLPPDHPERSALLRQLEMAAAVAGELESLLDL